MLPGTKPAIPFGSAFALPGAPADKPSARRSSPSEGGASPTHPLLPRIGQALPIQLPNEGLVEGALAAYRLPSPGRIVVQALLPDGRRVEAFGTLGAPLALSIAWGGGR